ncbi:hypothetical protein TGS27_2874 [Geobacillus stearothermophilus]|uniref:Uncharacterized protein n=1 Tax=Geobacillus stearothermophilus TaxID=1422 RepID=A0A150M8I1_GEOSE|nr:hypothetical protein B4109_0759 [Geobacillus stearothermophilus]OAO77164.1 hypothetical protein TGS27_2874 [Geobacillus stearothermophilus]
MSVFSNHLPIVVFVCLNIIMNITMFFLSILKQWGRAE